MVTKQARGTHRRDNRRGDPRSSNPSGGDGYEFVPGPLRTVRPAKQFKNSEMAAQIARDAASMAALDACDRKINEYSTLPVDAQTILRELCTREADGDSALREVTEAHDKLDNDLAAQILEIRRRQLEARKNFEKSVRERLATMRNLCALLCALGARLWHLVSTTTGSRPNWCGAATQPTPTG